MEAKSEKLAADSPGEPIEIAGSQKIDWMYPNIYGDSPDVLRISLYHVRAANDIEIEYSSQRDGWVVYQQVTTGFRNVGSHMDSVEKRKELAFIPAWDAEQVFEP